MPAFDYQAAKAAGHSDDEIAAYLKQQNAAGKDLFIPRAAIGAPAENTRTGQPDPGIRQPLPQWLGQMIREGGPPLLPIAGGIGGGMAGGIPGATIGGGVGRGLQDLVTGAKPPASLAEGINRYGGAAAQQGVLEGGGRAVANVAGRVGGVLTGNTLARAAAGAENVARSSPKLFNPQDVLKRLGPLANEQRIIGQGPEEALGGMMLDFLRNKNGQKMTALELHQFRQAMDAIGEEVQAARRVGMPVDAGNSLRARYAENTGNQARQMLKQDVKGYPEAMSQVSKAAGSQRRIPQVSQGPVRGTLTNPLGVPELATRAVLGPQAMQLYGNVLSSPLLAFLLQQTPRFLSAGVPPDTTSAR